MAVRYVRDTVWAKRKIMPPSYSYIMYSEEEGTYCSELIGVVKLFIPREWDPGVCWHVFLVSVKNSVYNSMRSKGTQEIKRTAKGGSKGAPASAS